MPKYLETKLLDNLDIKKKSKGEAVKRLDKA